LIRARGESGRRSYAALLRSARRRPLVCVTIFAKDRSEFVRTSQKASDLGCDLVELRIDYLIETNPSLISKIIANSPCPVIATCRSTEHGGKFPRSQEGRRLKLLESVINSRPTFVDLELETDEDRMTTLIQLAKRNGVGVICSHHDMKTTPSTEGMLSLAKDLQERHAEISKLVLTPHNNSDVQRILTVASRLGEQKQSFTLFGMGMVGEVTRIASLFLGGSLIYCSIGETKTALGQIGLADARSYLDSLNAKKWKSLRRHRSALLSLLGRKLSKQHVLDYSSIDFSKYIR
jgi:3-dehydroquinate dehydratase I